MSRESGGRPGRTASERLLRQAAQDFRIRVGAKPTLSSPGTESYRAHSESPGLPNLNWLNLKRDSGPGRGAGTAESEPTPRAVTLGGPTPRVTEMDSKWAGSGLPAP